MAKCYSEKCERVAKYISHSKAKDCRGVLACGYCTTCNLWSKKHQRYYSVRWSSLMPYMPIFKAMLS